MTIELVMVHIGPKREKRRADMIPIAHQSVDGGAFLSDSGDFVDIGCCYDKGHSGWDPRPGGWCYAYTYTTSLEGKRLWRFSAEGCDDTYVATA